MATSAGACGSPPADATTFAYDERGNRTGTTWPSGRRASFTYDQANRLVTAPDLDADLLVPGEVLPNTGTLLDTEATYAYNGDGLRIARTTWQGRTPFAWDYSAGLPMLLKEGEISYVHGPGGLPVERIDASGTVAYYPRHQRLGLLTI